MAKSKRWHQAMIASIVIHAVVLTSVVGWAALRFPVQTDVLEQYIELDLSQDVAVPSSDSKTSSRMADNKVSGLATAQPRAMLSASSTAATIANVVAESSSMAVLSAEVPTNVNADFVGKENTEGSGQGQVSDISGKSRVVEGGSGSGNKTSNGRAGENGYTYPGISLQVAPTYPESERCQGVQGTVLLKIQILSNGDPGVITIYRSSGSDNLDDAAVAAVQHWRFIPAKDRNTGETITCMATMPIIFRLD
jgi:periplasmic protein TonB